MKQTLVIFSDLHLFQDPDAKLRGVPTQHVLREVLAMARDHVPDPDLVVLTGDLAHDENQLTYRQLKDLLGDWDERVRVIPGNHDSRSAIRSVFCQQFETTSVPDRCGFAEQVGHWLLLGLDSQVPGETRGSIGEEQLDWLVTNLERHAERPTVLFSHHPPISVNSEWLDKIGMEDGDALCHLIARYEQIRLVCSGHIHQELHSSRGHTEFITSPSCCIQFRPGSREPAYDCLPAGFRIIELDGTSCRTRVQRLDSNEFPVVLE